MQLRRPVALLFIGTAFVACGDDGGGPGPPPGTLTRVAGDSQVGTAGQPLGTVLSVIARDAANSPQPGIAVTWAAAIGGGTVNPASATTGADGRATTTRTLGPNAGTQTTTASRSGLPTVTFTAIAQIQGATQIQANGGAPQTDTVLSTLATPLSVLVRNHLNAAVQGVIVTFTATGGDSVIGATRGTTALDTTDAGGVASVIRKLGPTAGTRAVQATVTGLTGSPVAFAGTGTAGAPARLRKTPGDSGDGQRWTRNSALPTPFSLTARDAYGNARSGVVVNWDTTGSGGSVTPTVDTTDQNGISTTVLTLGPALGTHTARATSATLPADTLSFTATAVTFPLTDSVDVGNNFFGPDSVLIGKGGQVTWTWAAGAITHNVTFTSGTNPPANISSRTSGSASGTFSTAGTFNYHCTIHPTTMIGKVLVAP
jgi:plastocyanin